MKETLQWFLATFMTWAVLSCSSAVVTDRVDAVDLEFASRQPSKELMCVPKDSIDYVHVENGVLCLFNVRERKGENHLALYDLNQGVLIRECIPYGANANEMLLPFLTVTSGHLFVYDPVKKEATDIEINQLLKESQYEPQYYHTNLYSQEIIPIRERLLFLNQYSFKGKAPRVRYSDSMWNYTEKHRYDFDAMNVVDGFLLYNQEEDRIAFLADYEPVIELMDGNGKLLKSVRFPHSVCEFVAVNYKSIGIVEYSYPYQESPSFPEYSFCAADSNEDIIVCSFWRDDWTFIVMAIDWHGNILDGFAVDSKIRNVSLSSDGKSVYCWEEANERKYLKQYELFL